MQCEFWTTTLIHFWPHFELLAQNRSDWIYWGRTLQHSRAPLDKKRRDAGTDFCQDSTIIKVRSDLLSCFIVTTINLIVSIFLYKNQIFLKKRKSMKGLVCVFLIKRHNNVDCHMYKVTKSPSQSAPTILVLKTRVSLGPWKKIGHPAFVMQKEKRQPGLFSFWITMTLFFAPCFLHPAFCTPFWTRSFFQDPKPTHVFKTRTVGADWLGKCIQSKKKWEVDYVVTLKGIEGQTLHHISATFSLLSGEPLWGQLFLFCIHIEKSCLQVYTKGQLISKCLFGVFNSSKKRTKIIWPEVS